MSRLVQMVSTPSPPPIPFPPSTLPTMVTDDKTGGLIASYVVMRNFVEPQGIYSTGLQSPYSEPVQFALKEIL